MVEYLKLLGGCIVFAFLLGVMFVALFTPVVVAVKLAGLE